MNITSLSEATSTNWAVDSMELIVSTHEVSVDIGDYIELLSPKINFEASSFTSSRPNPTQRREIRRHEKEIINSLNILKRLISGLQIRTLDKLDPLTESDLTILLEQAKNPPSSLSELKKLIERLKSRKLDTSDAESIYTAYHTTYKLFATTLNRQVAYYNETYQSSLPLVSTPD